MMTRALSVAALALLAGCGNQGGSGITEALKGAAGRLVGQEEKTEAAPAAPTDEALAGLAANGPALRVEIPKFGVVVGAAPLAVNAHKVTWIAGGATITTQSGFVLATRGLPGDLMAVQVEGFGEALSGGGSYSRQMEWLNGRDETIRKAFTCTVSIISGQTVAVLRQSYSATLYEDVCRGEGIEFKNKYWIDEGRQLRQTEQWISETVGYLQSQQLPGKKG